MAPSRSSSADDRPLARAAALAVSAVVLYWLVEQRGVSFGKVPLLTGLGYLAGAVAGGPRGALWAPALVVTGWGLGNDAQGWESLSGVGLPESAAHMVGMGLGILALGVLARYGIETTLWGVGLSVLLSGVLFIGQRGEGYQLLNEATGYSLLLLVYAAAEVVGVAVRRR
ncbi:MAG: hypothetical protein Q8R60_08750 [Mycobacteriales bacterium]|nr:hypothetical protein [Mycobacteriales bacterium]